MPLLTLSFTGTKEARSLRLRSLTLSRVSIGVYCIAALIFGVVSIQNKDPWPFLIASFLLLFFTHVMKLFLEEELENDAMPLPENAPIESWLSHELITRLAPKGKASAGDVLEAAVSTERGRFILDELGIDARDMVSKCRNEIDRNVELEMFLNYAKQLLSTFHETRIDANTILYLFFTFVVCCTELLHAADVSEEELKGLLHWEHFHHHFRRREHLWSPHVIARNSSLGRSWITGYTNALDALTTEIDATTEETGERSVVIHKEAIDAVLRALMRSKERNVLILGKTGIGKRTLIRNVVAELRSHERTKHLPFTSVRVLHTEKLLSGVDSPDSFLLHALGRAQHSGRFILVIRDLALLLRSANANLMAVMKKFLESNTICVVAIADTQDYHSLIKTDPMLDSIFQKVTVEDATDDETMETLMAHYFSLENSNVRITFKALKSILDLTKRFLSMRGGLPGSALDVMDEAVHRAAENGDTFVREAHVREVVSLKSRVNVQQVSEGEKERLLVLDEAIKKRVIGQDNAVHAVVSSLKRARMDLRERMRPVGTFLFLGPTGVGKTETAKVLAEEYFGASDAMIRLDMNEYSHADSVFGVIGQPGMSDGFLAQRVQDKPFSLILLDEIEKAHPNVLNLFLQILDEGFLTDSRSVRTDFRNTIIIATSNAGALFIRDYLQKNENYDKQAFKNALVDFILQQKLFTPEFVNRFDELVLFYPLSQENAGKVAHLMIDSIISDLQKRRGISVRLEDGVIDALLSIGYSAEFGAREMRRTITTTLEDYLANYLLQHDVKRGETITIRAVDLL